MKKYLYILLVNAMLLSAQQNIMQLINTTDGTIKAIVNYDKSQSEQEEFIIGTGQKIQIKSHRCAHSIIFTSMTGTARGSTQTITPQWCSWRVSASNPHPNPKELNIRAEQLLTAAAKKR